jgi:SAM-dependent methyltransferase
MKLILDPCCGSKMFWFDKNQPNTIYCDKRKEEHILCDGRTLNIDPDFIMDFTDLKFADNTFKLVVFDPPHLFRCGKSSWLAKKYGRLDLNWKEELSKGFNECYRVLDENGVLIFKWNERDIKVSELLDIFGKQPLFGHKTHSNGHTIWLTFMKINND